MDTNGNLRTLLLKDLCSRLPYGVICHYDCVVPSVGKVINYDRLNGIIPIQDTIGFMVGVHSVNALFDNIKPYLHPMSSMTEEEKEEMYKIYNKWFLKGGSFDMYIEVIDWLNKHHFDYRGLIEKGLALEAPEGMYNIKEK